LSWQVLAAITRKDIVDAIRHRYLLTALLTPVFVALLFRFLLPGVNNRSSFTVAVHDPTKSAMVTKLRNTLQVVVVDAPSAEALPSEVENRNAVGGLIIPANFDADIAAGKQPELTIYVNNRKTSFEQAGFRRMVEQLLQSLVKYPEPARVGWIDLDKETNVRVRGMSLEQMLLPLLLILTLGMTGALIVPMLLVEEKEKRTLDFLMASPASLKEIIAGKALTGVVYTVLIAGLLLVINRQVIGNWLMTSLTIVIGLLFVVAVGLLMGGLLNNTMQVNTWASSVLIVLLAPSFPSLGLPAAVNTIMRLIPTYYLNEALTLSLRGIWTTKIWIDLIVVLVCTIIAFFAAGWALYRRRQVG
jgi:ABC-2 type transport system permease protein